MNTHLKSDSVSPLRILVMIPRGEIRMQVVRALEHDLSADVHVAEPGLQPGSCKAFDAAVVGPEVHESSRSCVAELPTVVIGHGACTPDIHALVRRGVQAELPARCLQCESERLLSTNVLWAVERSHLLRRLRLAEHRHQHAAFHDVLTGLPNRRLFRDRLRQLVAQEKRSHKRFALFMLDLDRFKRVNDRWGHETGDLYLCAVADALRECVRETDTLARIGGDEFAILFDDVGERADAERLARRILQRVSRPWVISGHVVRPSLSLGVAVFPEDATSSCVLERRADAAMYAAKNSGGHAFRNARRRAASACGEETALGAQHVKAASPSVRLAPERDSKRCTAREKATTCPSTRR